ncbi:MAG: hypothetical protein JWN73_3897 [Betaproteobacteria bacterium]|nr:hypothetical protein [Betaproteobacteria bacterium]
MSPQVTDALLAYLHFISIFATFGMLCAELVLCRGPLVAAQVQRLARIDIAYFACAMAVLATGLLRLFFGAKGVAFYLHNPVFHAKLGLFVLVGLLSVPPTLRFIAWRKRMKENEQATVTVAEAKSAARLIHIELALLAIIPLLAVLMARGVGIKAI